MGSDLRCPRRRLWAILAGMGNRIKSDTDVIEFEGVRYTRRPGKRYYKTVRRGVGNDSLHRAIWRARHGPISKGHVIHHVDGDWNNNSIENLVCVPKGQHVSTHMAAWYSSREGREFKRLLTQQMRDRCRAEGYRRRIGEQMRAYYATARGEQRRRDLQSGVNRERLAQLSRDNWSRWKFRVCRRCERRYRGRAGGRRFYCPGCSDAVRRERELERARRRSRVRLGD